MYIQYKIIMSCSYLYTPRFCPHWSEVVGLNNLSVLFTTTQNIFVHHSYNEARLVQNPLRCSLILYRIAGKFGGDLNLAVWRLVGGGRPTPKQ